MSLKNQYSPYTRPQAKTIRDLWNLRKSTVGLEGTVYMETKAQNPNASESEIAEKVNRHFENVAGEKAAWNGLRSEMRK